MEMTSVLTDESTGGRETVGLCCCSSGLFNGSIAILAWTSAGKDSGTRTILHSENTSVRSNIFCGTALCWQHIDFRSWRGDYRQVDILHYRNCHAWHFRVASIVFAGRENLCFDKTFWFKFCRKLVHLEWLLHALVLNLSVQRAAFPHTSTLDNSSAFKVILAFILETYLIMWTRVF